jgi:hypothetical protein
LDYCAAGGACVAKQPNGQSCTASNQCASGNCNAGICQTAQTIHSNGVGQTFSDFNPLNTFTSATATEACNANATSLGGSAANCHDGWSCPFRSGTTMVCYGNTAGTTCDGYCWIYQGGSAGIVTTCGACNTNASTWN